MNLFNELQDLFNTIEMVGINDIGFYEKGDVSSTLLGLSNKLRSLRFLLENEPPIPPVISHDDSLLTCEFNEWLDVSLPSWMRKIKQIIRGSAPTANLEES